MPAVAMPAFACKSQTEKISDVVRWANRFSSIRNAMIFIEVDNKYYRLLWKPGSSMCSAFIWKPVLCSWPCLGAYSDQGQESGLRGASGASVGHTATRIPVSSRPAVVGQGTCRCCVVTVSFIADAAQACAPPGGEQRRRLSYYLSCLFGQLSAAKCLMLKIWRIMKSCPALSRSTDIFYLWCVRRWNELLCFYSDPEFSWNYEVMFGLFRRGLKSAFGKFKCYVRRPELFCVREFLAKNDPTTVGAIRDQPAFFKFAAAYSVLMRFFHLYHHLGRVRMRCYLSVSFMFGQLPHRTVARKVSIGGFTFV